MKFDISTRAEARDCLRWFLTNFPTYPFDITFNTEKLSLEDSFRTITIYPDRTITICYGDCDVGIQTGFDYGGMLDVFRKGLFTEFFSDIGETFTSILDYDLHILDNGFVCFTPETSCVRGVYCEFVNGHFEEGGRLHIYMKGRTEPIIQPYRYWSDISEWITTFFSKLDVGDIEGISD